MSAAELDPADPSVAPLLQAIGRAVLGAAALEKVLLVDIAQRQAARDGLAKQLARDLSRLERQPAGALLRTLCELGIPAELAAGIEDVIVRRNQLVHRLMEDAQLLAALGGTGVNRAVERVDELAADCQRLINGIAPDAFAGAERALGAPLPELFQMLQGLDPETVDDERLRAQLELVCGMDPEHVAELHVELLARTADDAPVTPSSAPTRR
jgi:hypothetical protein